MNTYMASLAAVRMTSIRFDDVFDKAAQRNLPPHETVFQILGCNAVLDIDGQLQYQITIPIQIRCSESLLLMPRVYGWQPRTWSSRPERIKLDVRAVHVLLASVQIYAVSLALHSSGNCGITPAVTSQFRNSEALCVLQNILWPGGINQYG